MKRSQNSLLCVYTILHTDKLRTAFAEGRKGNFTEKKKWVTATHLFREASFRGQKLPVIFASAEDTEDLIYHAVIDRIDIHDPDSKHPSSTCWFTELTAFKPPRPKKTSLIVQSTGKKIPAKHIRPYVICRTPSFL